MGWFSTIVKVAYTAAGMYLASQKSDDIESGSDVVSTDIGVFTFTKNVQTGQASLKNNSEAKYYAYFSITNNDGSLSSKHLLIDGKGESDVTEIMGKYVNGQITYAPYETGGETKESLLSFSAETMFNRKLEFNDDDSAVTYVLEQNNEHTQLIFSSPEKFASFQLTFVDKNGTSFIINDLKIDEVRGFYEARVDIPKGCSPELPYNNLRLQVTIPEETSNLIEAELASR